MNHYANPSFWACYEKLPEDIQRLADKNFELLKTNQNHPSLQLKKVGKYRSVRVSAKYRALGVEIKAGIIWFWIGNHSEYDKLIS
ncbi:MAG: hypothetical protein V1872_12980 [bacterium]